MNPVAIRLLNQQLIAPQFKTPTEVVSHMGAMQAQEYRMMRWAVEMRTKKPSHKAFKEAYDSGQIILRTSTPCPQQQRYLPTHHCLRRHHLRQLVSLQR